MGRRAGIAIVAAAALLELLDVFGRVDLVLGKLRGLRAVGQMIATILVSPSFRLTIILVGFGLVLYRKATSDKFAMPVISVTPGELLAFYRTNTSYQAEKLFGAYKGRVADSRPSARYRSNEIRWDCYDHDCRGDYEGCF